ncbi:MAG: aerolysin family beta-barrel pore-forming toxin, partial [Propionibacteriaceae bacterium]|nr:aerolysin family beta-barrel pore-forming toxin [Propionibacteriaceae bacterium]
MKIKRILGTALASALILANVPGTGFAADTSYTPKAFKDNYTVDGVTYKDAFGLRGRDLANPYDFYLNALQIPVPITGALDPGGMGGGTPSEPLFKLWKTAGRIPAFNLGFDSGDAEDSGSIQFAGQQYYYPYSYSGNTVGDFLRQGYNAISVLPGATEAGIEASMVHLVKNDTLNVATDLAAAESQIISDTYPALTPAMQVVLGMEDVTPLKDKTEKQVVLYSVDTLESDVYSFDLVTNYLGQARGHLATYFYDFKLSYLETGEEAPSDITGKQSFDEIKKAPNVQFTESSPGQTYFAGVKNLSSKEVSAQQTVSQSHTTTVSNEVLATHSEDYSWSEMIGTEVTFGQKFPTGTSFQAMFKTEFTGTQAFSDSTTHSASTSEEHSESVDNTIAMALPPHTQAQMHQNRSNATLSFQYDYPVAINYRVKQVAYVVLTNSSNFPTHAKGVFDFGDEDPLTTIAPNSLKSRWDHRGNTSFDTTLKGDGDAVNWGKSVTEATKVSSASADMGWAWTYPLKSSNTGAFTSDYGTLVNLLYNNRPMSVTGGVMTLQGKSVSSEVNDIVPIYPLRTISQTSGATDYDIASGERFYVDNIELAGYNPSRVPFYGFDKGNGHWALVDENQKQLTSSPIASLETNPVTGYTSLVAGNTAGTVYLKYFIDEDVYTFADYISADGTTKYQKNDASLKTSIIAINVSSKPFSGTIAIKGKLTGIVGDPAISLDDPDASGIDLSVQDSTGREVARPVTWEAKELPSRGVLVDNNKISFSKAGTFHVRAVIGNLVSEWVSVEAAEPVELQSVTAPKAITGLENGTAKTAAALQIPTKVTLRTTAGNVEADTAWDVAASTY